MRPHGLTSHIQFDTKDSISVCLRLFLGSISIEIIRKEAPRGTKKSETDDRQSDSSSGSSSDESDENEPTLPEEESIENIPPQNEPSVPQK